MISSSPVDYSIVVPVYFNEGCLERLVSKIKEEVVAINSEMICEILFVDDGSEDGSLEEMCKILDANRGLVRVAKLTRNFGQVNAVRAGMVLARGKCVIIISADNQDPPGLINEMLHAHYGDGCEVVIAARSSREDSFDRIIASKLFYRMMKKLSFPSIPSGGFDYVLLGKKALNVLTGMADSTQFLQGQILWLGFKTRTITYRRTKRLVGESQWSMRKKISLFVDSVISNTFTPIRILSLIGISVAVMGFVYALTVFLSKILIGNAIKGWTPLVIIVLIMGGLQLTMLGIIGEYIWRILDQVRSRPKYIVERIYE